MQFAVIGDIHSNLYALRRVLLGIRKKDVDFILCTGDLVGYSPFPNEVIDLLKRNRVISIQGNYDKAIGNMEPVCGCDYKEPHMIELAAHSMAFTSGAVTEDARTYLRDLPKELRLKCENHTLLLVHGSPRRINESLLEDSNEMQEVIEAFPEDILLCGHTHIPYYKRIGDKHVINCGTVGKPVSGNPDACYAVVGVDKDNISVEIVSVRYDVEKAAKAIEENDGLPDEFAWMLRTGRNMEGDAFGTELR